MVSLIMLLRTFLWSCNLCTQFIFKYYFVLVLNGVMLLFRPQTTIGTAMVLCHRFFVRRSHACLDRFVSILLFLSLKCVLHYLPLNCYYSNCDSVDRVWRVMVLVLSV